MEVFLGELSFERCGDLFVVLLKLSRRDLVKGVEVVWRDDFTLLVGELDFHLVEPGRVHGPGD